MSEPVLAENFAEKPAPIKVRKYKCNYCDRAFLRSEHRSRHERSHTKERPFKCPTCPSTFVRRDLLLRHDRTVHSKKRPESSGHGPGQRPGHNVDASTNGPANGNSNSNSNANNNGKYQYNLHTSAEDSLGGNHSNAVDLSSRKVPGVSIQSPNPSGYFNKMSIPMMGTTPSVSTPTGSGSFISYKSETTNSTESDHYDAALAIANLQTLGSSNPNSANSPNTTAPTTTTTTATTPTTAASKTQLPSISNSLSNGLAPLHILHHQKSSAVAEPAEAPDTKPPPPPPTALLENPEKRPNKQQNTASPPNYPQLSPLMTSSSISEGTARDLGPIVSPRIGASTTVYGFPATTPSAGHPYSDKTTMLHHNHRNRHQHTSSPQSPYDFGSGAIPGTVRNSFPAPKVSLQSPIPQFGPHDSMAHLLRYFSSSPELDNNEDLSSAASSSSSSCTSASPSKILLNRFLSAYFNFFHPAFPFLHIQTFDAKDTPPALIFSICSIGALICQDFHMASCLNMSAKMLLSSIEEMNRDFHDSQTLPIWMVQSMLLSLVFASWSNDTRLFETIRSIKPRLLAAATDLVKQTSSVGQSSMSFSVWVYNESITRTYLCAYRIFASLNVIMNYPLAISCDQLRELGVKMPCSETLWATYFTSEDHWQAYVQQESPAILFNDVSSWLSQASLYDSKHVPKLGAFALFIISLSMSLDPMFKNHPSLAQCWKALVEEELDSNWESSVSDAQKWLEPLHGSSYPSILESDILLDPSQHYHQHPLIDSSTISVLTSELEKSSIDLSAVKDTFRYHISHDISQAAFSTMNQLVSTGALKGTELVPLVVSSFGALFKGPLLSGANLSIDAYPSMGSLKVNEILAGTQLALFVVMWVYHVEQGLADAGRSSSSEREGSSSSSGSGNSMGNSNVTTTGNTSLLSQGPSNVCVNTFDAIEELCYECGTLDRYRAPHYAVGASSTGTLNTNQNQLAPAGAMASVNARNSPPLAGSLGPHTLIESHVSFTLCMLYADVLDSVGFCGFSQVLSASMRDLAVKFSPQKPNSNRFSRKRYAAESFGGGYVVSSSKATMGSPIVAASNSFYKPIATFHAYAEPEVKSNVSPVSMKALLDKSVAI